MTEQEALAKMVAPSMKRPGAYRGGIIQIHVTRACDKSCFNCTQGSNLRGSHEPMHPKQFETALESLKGYWGVIGVFGGNPAVSKYFENYCYLLQKHVPFEQRGLWCNNPLGHGKLMRATFNPAVSNLNVHMDRRAYLEFKKDWPECSPVGLERDSRHSPPWVAMKDVLRKECSHCDGGRILMFAQCEACSGKGWIYDEARAWHLISNCDINQHWSAMIGVFRGELRAWFCEIAGAQSMLHQDDPDYPDTGLDPSIWYEPRVYTYQRQRWWQLSMDHFAKQVRKHCHECGVPLRGHGELAMAGEEGIEQVSATHEAIYKTKKPNRRIQLVTVEDQLGAPLPRMTDYIRNATK